MEPTFGAPFYRVNEERSQTLAKAAVLVKVREMHAQSAERWASLALHAEMVAEGRL